MSIVAAIVALVVALASMYSLVPRIRLVEAISLFAAAFAAGASLVSALNIKPDSRG
jgi:hypothetical protein